MLFFALVLQPVLQEVQDAHPEAGVIATTDEVTLQGDMLPLWRLRRPQGALKPAV